MSSPADESCPVLQANIFSQLFYTWISPLLRKSHKQGVLELNDLYALPPYLKSTDLTDKLETNWFDEVKRCPKNPSLIRVTLRTFGWKPILRGVLALLHGMAQITVSLLFTFLMGFFEPCSSMPAWHAWLLAIAIILIPLCASLTIHRHFYRTDIYALQISAAYAGLIYRKVLRLSSHSINTITSGEITNLLSNDCNTVQLMLFFINYLWVAPLQTIFITIVFWHFIKYIAFIAIAYSVFLLLVQPLYTRIFTHLRTKILRVTDERIKIMSEIIQSMRIVKMYCWETAFNKRICHLRKREILQYTLYSLVDCIQILLSNNSTNISLLITFGTMWLLNIQFDTRFFVIACCILNFMRIYVIEYFSLGIRFLANYLAARKRIESFLSLDEYGQNNRLLSSSNERETVNNDNIEKNIQVICNLKQAQWQKNGLFVLKNIIFDAHPGDLICIIGPVGSGKSSLLQTLTDEITYFDGEIQLDGSYCYVPQEAWIFSSTIKNNILFGKEYNHYLFQRAVRATALDTDFKQLSNGANTLVGDHGVMLSGGQKARVNMARALYHNADIYLLDDPLSALDVKVAKHLFERAIKRYLRDKVCILVTHQIQFLQEATKIIVLHNGEMIQIGTYSELISSSTSFSYLLDDSHQQRLGISKHIQKQQSTISTIYSEKGDDDEEELMTNIDTKQEGSVKWNVYSSYIRAGLGCIFGFFFILLILVAHQAILLYSSWWLATWSDDESRRYKTFNQCTSITNKNMNNLYSMTENEWNEYRNRKFYIYCGITILLLLLTFLCTFTLKLMCLNAGRVLHNKMFQRIIRCPILFFDMNPIGRILNHFTRDVAMMDTDLSRDVPLFLQCLSSVVGVLALVGLINAWSFISGVIGIIGLLVIRYRFARCFRDLKRIEGITRSPVYSYLSSTIHGLKVIRSHYAEKMCSKEFLSYFDDNTRANFFIAITERWAALRFEWITLIFLGLVTSFAILVRLYHKEFSTAAIALMLSYSFSLMGLLQWTIRLSVRTETEMTAVERVLEYCSLDQEPAAQVLTKYRPPNNWPLQGQIVFDNVSLKYSNDEYSPLALRNITLTIEGGEKIGIVGRTGAGKSSFIQTLFRMGILVNGQIEIDNINITTIGLDDLRSRISIIPQDPILFSGTIRYNLDQFNNYSDDQIWNALEEVQLKTLVNNLMSDGLDSLITENGSNLSIGQKQLICLARAILKKSKILVIDEATANVDNATDELIQQVIRNKFKECTVLTIAHRLRTVIDNDRIMVINNGELVELDTPFALLSNSNSYFSSLAEQAGQAEAEYLRTLVNRMDRKKESIKQKQIDNDDDKLTSAVNENDPLLV
ncbi:unnamed protein product [Rotaria sordida]|uniref:Uncharacterized protein n=1 Tax=Rotaria sordida TaxID=392033 RepID=A0A814B9Z9_9BILA|nr:unnamed protein product [Rotaria sordida]CAF0925224.1 unnamed protein product [Rotaria sordida]